MASERPQLSAAPDSPQHKVLCRAKFRVRFRKAGDIRFVSHHDLMHIFERTFRRADLSVPTTQGFNPRPRMWFALSLALGIAGLNEVMELELSEPLGEDEVCRRLVAHVPPGIEIRSVRAIDTRMSARVRRAWVRLPLQASSGDLEQRCAGFMSQADCWIERVRPQRRRINLRQLTSELHARADGLEMALWVTPKGTARPEEIIAALGFTSLLDEGAALERTDLEIIDELPPGAAGVPALEIAFEEIGGNDRDPPQESPGAARPTAIMDDPMSFDS